MSAAPETTSVLVGVYTNPQFGGQIPTHPAELFQKIIDRIAGGLLIEVPNKRRGIHVIQLAAILLVPPHQDDHIRLEPDQVFLRFECRRRDFQRAHGAAVAHQNGDSLGRHAVGCNRKIAAGDPVKMIPQFERRELRGTRRIRCDDDRGVGLSVPGKDQCVRFPDFLPDVSGLKAQTAKTTRQTVMMFLNMVFLMLLLLT